MERYKKNLRDRAKIWRFFGIRAPKHIQISKQLSNIKITVDLCNQKRTGSGINK